jgi:hypothetical protein
MFDPTCPNPMHRLFALVGKDRIDHEMATTDWPNLLSAVAYLVLEEHSPEQWQQALALVLEAAPRPLADPVAEAGRLDAEQFWVEMMAEAVGMDPATGEWVRPPIYDHPRSRTRPHGPRRGPFRRR